MSQDLHFTRPVRIGDTLTVTATVVSKDDSRKRVELACQAINQKGESVLHGMAQVIAPTQKVRLPKPQAPQIQLFDPQALRTCWPWARACRPSAARWCTPATPIAARRHRRSRCCR